MFDLKKVPFSRFGSYFSISEIDDKFYLRDLHCGDESESNLFLLDFYYGDLKIRPEIKVTETFLSFTHKDGKVLFCFGEESLVNIKTTKMKLKITFIKNRYDSLIRLDNNTYHYDFYTKEIKYLFKKVSGEIEVNAPWKYVGNEYINIWVNENSYVVIEEFKITGDYFKNYNEFEFYLKKLNNEYNEFYNKMSSCIDLINEDIKLAIYIMWSCFVHPSGILKQPTLYMSKNHMNNIWSWDNAFNAISLSKDFPELSFKQIEMFYDFQDNSGVYPDFINDKFVSYNCAKPPVHSWAFNIMRKNNNFFNNREILEKAYQSFKKQGEFWLKYRTLNKHNLPVYFHGNDSGWDNSSVFREEMPVISPDLICHLIRHFDILGEMACELDYLDDAKKMKEDANFLFHTLIKDFYIDGKFIARKNYDYSIIDNQDSLLLMIPLIISYRLSESIIDSMIKNIKENFLTDFGLSTESLNSKFYKDNGYWLGPIWAAPTFFIIDALKNTKHNGFSIEIRNKFYDLISVGKLAENFDAKTGQGLSDTAFTWTSGVYLSLKKGLI